MHENLAIVTNIIAAGRSTREQERRWTRNLLGLLPHVDPTTGLRDETDTRRFVDLCHHLGARAETREERRELVDALAEAERTLPWAEPLFFEIDQVLAGGIDDLYHVLADEFAATDDPDTAAGIYAEMRDHCHGLDQSIAALASASPHVTGRSIVEDFYETIAERLPDGILAKLEDEEEHLLLDEIIGWDESGSRARLETLRNPDAYLEGLLDRCRKHGTSTPLWVWCAGVLDERFDLLRSKVPWDELSDYADGDIQRQIDEHLADELGDDMERWENFVCLEMGFCGTLDELVTAAKHL